MKNKSENNMHYQHHMIHNAYNLKTLLKYNNREYKQKIKTYNIDTLREKCKHNQFRGSRHF